MILTNANIWNLKSNVLKDTLPQNDNRWSKNIQWLTHLLLNYFKSRTNNPWVVAAEQSTDPAVKGPPAVTLAPCNGLARSSSEGQTCYDAMF